MSFRFTEKWSGPLGRTSMTSHGESLANATQAPDVRNAAMAIGQAESVKPWPWDEPLIGGGSLQACLHTKRLNLGFMLGLAKYIYIHIIYIYIYIYILHVPGWRKESQSKRHVSNLGEASLQDKRKSSDAISHCLWYPLVISHSYWKWPFIVDFL